MPKVKISEYSATANSNTDVASINIDEGCAPSGINNAIRAVMGHLKDFQQGTYGDPFNGPVNGTLGATTASTANVTTLTTSSTVTHNGGTANGVAYLNGSKVLTSGSALVFDGTKLGVGAAATEKLQSNAGIAATGANLSVGSLDGFVADYGSGVSRLFASRNGVATGTMAFWTTDSSGTAGERMRLDASGNLGIGQTNPAKKLDVYLGTTGTVGQYLRNTTVNLLSQIDGTTSAQFGTETSHPLVFLTGNTERARIDSSGNLLVGTTSGTARLNIQSTSSTDRVGYFENTAATPTGEGLMVNFSNETGTNTGTALVFAARTAGANRFYVYGNGTYGTVSDLNLKKNIETARDGYLDDLMKLRVVKYNWVTDEDETPKELGWIAQELETVFPRLVQDSRPNEDGVTYKEVKTSVLPYMLLKAIQEQNQLIQSLTDRITALEAK